MVVIFPQSLDHVLGEFDDGKHVFSGNLFGGSLHLELYSKNDGHLDHHFDVEGSLLENVFKFVLDTLVQLLKSHQVGEDKASSFHIELFSLFLQVLFGEKLLDFVVPLNVGERFLFFHTGDPHILELNTVS